MWQPDVSHPASWGAGSPSGEAPAVFVPVGALLAWRLDILASRRVSKAEALLMLQGACTAHGLQTKVLEAVRARTAKHDDSLMHLFRSGGVRGPAMTRLVRAANRLLHGSPRISGEESWIWLALVGFSEYVGAARRAFPHSCPISDDVASGLARLTALCGLRCGL